MLGYTAEDCYKMLEAVGVAYNNTDFDQDIMEGLKMSFDFIAGILSEGHVS
jgi:hypothetical protein